MSDSKVKITFAAVSNIPPAISDQVEPLEGELAPKLAVELGLTLEEYAEIVRIQGRIPSLTELYMYSLMWSEHCSYKQSREQLAKFPTDGPNVLQGPGENAGVIDVGDGWAVAFKMETHNHPSAIEPFQGAATGVGGIIRDIFTMGARPIALLDSLCFGTLDQPRQRYLFEGAVAGIGSYGNCIGVPTVGGEVFFEEAYEGNCLIIVMGVGLMRADQLTRAVGSGPGNLVVLLGSTTGRDGIGGASVLASQEFDEAAEEKRPAVQVGDPFEEKLLIEACLELRQRGLFVALGDFGAAGLTCAASEMASRGGVGIDIDVQKVLRREPDMQPFEVMVSESQERMLAVVKPEDWEAVHEVASRWGVSATPIGTITDTGRFIVRDSELSDDPIGQIVADMPAEVLAHAAPLYHPLSSRPAYLDELAAFDPYTLAHPESADELSAAWLRMIASPNVCSREWIYSQYDHQVQNNTVVLPGADAAVVRIGDTGRGEMTNRGLAMVSDSNGRYCYLNPYLGAQLALAEAARNLACVGAEPAAITDSLNFGNPEKPEVYYTFIGAVDGLADACRAFGLPVTGGNVSFYNETSGSAIYPTPAIGMVGLIDDISLICTPGFKAAGDTIVLIGETDERLGGSEYLKLEHDVVAGALPELDLDLEKDVQAVVRQAVRSQLLQSAHDISDGGLAVALAESAIVGGLGASVTLGEDLPAVASLFSESPSRVLVSASEDAMPALLELLAEAEVPYSVIGEVGGEAVEVCGPDGPLAALPLAELDEAYRSTLAALVGY